MTESQLVPIPTEPDNAAGRCLACDGQMVEPFLNLGSTALANKFLAEEELTWKEPAYPLRVGFCHDCSHVQLTEVVPPSAMFEDYLYVSSASSTLSAHLDELGEVIVTRQQLGPADLVVDIGCNDGTLLKSIRRHGVRTLGVDPAANLAALDAGSGVERVTAFFTSTTAREIAERWGRASAISATNVFPHIPDLGDFLQGIETLLAPGGVFVIEAHYLLDLLEQRAFDTIYHEHVSYWALGPMIKLFERHGFHVVRAERLPLHHGQLRVWVQRRNEGIPDDTIDAVLAQERAHGLDRFETYLQFAEDAQGIKRSLRETLLNLRAAGRSVAAYGAPAKGNTLIGYLELGPDLIEYIVDRSPLKQGRYTPGAHIPVVSTSRLLEAPPDYLVLLAWNFKDEVMEQQALYRERGGRFIVPLPKVLVI